MEFPAYNLLMAKSPRLDITEIRSVTDFQRNAKTHLARLKRTKSPIVLTINGSAAAVMQDPVTYQQLIDRVEEMDERERLIAAINEGLEDIKMGRVVNARDLKYRGR